MWFQSHVRGSLAEGRDVWGRRWRYVAQAHAFFSARRCFMKNFARFFEEERFDRAVPRSMLAHRMEVRSPLSQWIPDSLVVHFSRPAGLSSETQLAHSRGHSALWRVAKRAFMQSR
jgi:hypothetical protein